MLESGWRRKDHRNIKFFWYEELKKDQKKIRKEICQFISYNLDRMDFLCAIYHLYIVSFTFYILFILKLTVTYLFY